MSIAPVKELPLFKQNLGAIGLCAAGFTFLSFADTISKWLSQDYGVAQIIVLTSVPTLLIAVIWTITGYGVRGFVTPYFKWHILRGVCGAGTAFMVVHALSLIPMADVYGIVFLSPLILALLSHLLLGEKIGWHRLLAILAGFAGVIIIAGPQFETYNAGILFAFGTVFFICCNGLTIRKTKDETVLPLYAVYPMAFNIVINLPLMARDFRMPEAAGLPLFALAGPVLIGGLVCFAAGLARATESAVVMPFHYIQMIWGVVFGYFLFHDAPGAATITGSVIVAGSGLYLIWREHRVHKNSLILT